MLLVLAVLLVWSRNNNLMRRQQLGCVLELHALHVCCHVLLLEVLCRQAALLAAMSFFCSSLVLILVRLLNPVRACVVDPGHGARAHEVSKRVSVHHALGEVLHGSCRGVDNKRRVARVNHTPDPLSVVLIDDEAVTLSRCGAHVLGRKPKSDTC